MSSDSKAGSEPLSERVETPSETAGSPNDRADTPSKRAATPGDGAGTPSEMAETASERAETPSERAATPAEEGVVTDIPMLRTAKRLKIEARKLDGMQRELYSLMGENAAPVVVAPAAKFKTRPEWQQKATPWKLADFEPKEGLHLQHWVRAASLVEGLSGHRFARFNTDVDMPEWTDDQYMLFERPDWSLKETRYLFDLAKEFDLRWLVIADRYDWKGEDVENEESADENAGTEKSDEEKDTEKAGEEKPDEEMPDEEAPEEPRNKRSVEALKERYYEVCRALIKSKPVIPDVGPSPRDEELLKALNFDRSLEETRKDHLRRLLSRNPKEVAEEEALVLEARKLEAQSAKMLSERQNLLRLLESPANLATTNALKLELNTSQGVGQLLQDLTNDRTKRTQLGANGNHASKEGEPSARKTVAKIVGKTLERRLTPREEAMLGIQYIDPGKTKSSGVYLRSSKLTQVRQSILPKVRTILTELGLPFKPVMPTEKVCAEYESLYRAVTVLLEAKKIQDKLEMEVDILKKAREPQADAGPTNE